MPLVNPKQECGLVFTHEELSALLVFVRRAGWQNPDEKEVSATIRDKILNAFGEPIAPTCLATEATDSPTSSYCMMERE